MLDLAKPAKLSLCIPLGLRNEQIKAACARIAARLEPQEPRHEPIAVACFGPSLRDTWRQTREYAYLMTCSGAHKFLAERGVIPDFHCEVDPRPHKVDLIGTPHRKTRYLISSSSHPDLLDHLADMDVTLWHSLGPDDDDWRVLPAGEWSIVGGSNVGLRALAVASFLGFRELHVFGMDGNLANDASHAAAHPNAPDEYGLFEYGGRAWRTTPAMLEAAKATFEELDALPKIRAKFYGDGLVQALARDYVPKGLPEPVRNTVAFQKPRLISPEMLELNRRLHRDNLAYGISGVRHAPAVIRLKQETGADSVLDWGAGKGHLAKALPFPIWQFDPAVPEFEETAKPADLVVCTDCLEHIEPEYLDVVLLDLRRCVRRYGYFTICTVAALKKYADGRNAHLIQQPKEWWLERLGRFFSVIDCHDGGQELLVIVARKVSLDAVPS